MLHSHFYILIRSTLFDKLKETVNDLQEPCEQTVTEMLYYGYPNLKGYQNSQITIKYIIDSKKFSGSLF